MSKLKIDYKKIFGVIAATSVTLGAVGVGLFSQFNNKKSDEDIKEKLIIAAQKYIEGNNLDIDKTDVQTLKNNNLLENNNVYGDFSYVTRTINENGKITYKPTVIGVTRDTLTGASGGIIEPEYFEASVTYSPSTLTNKSVEVTIYFTTKATIINPSDYKLKGWSESVDTNGYTILKKIYYTNGSETLTAMSPEYVQLSKTISVTNIDEHDIVITGATNNATYDRNVTVSFDKGTGVLNGTTLSGKSFTTDHDGKYVLRVTTESGWDKTITFYVYKNKPTLDNDNIENNGIYNTNKTISFSSPITATLNGKTITSPKTVSEGTYTLVLTNQAGATTTIKFTIDKTSPILSLTPVSNAKTNGNVTLTLTSNENITITNIQPSGVEYKKLSSTKYEITAEDNYQVIVTAQDKAKNSVSTSYTIKNIDRQKPTGNLKSLNTEITDGNVEIELIVNEPLKNLPTCTGITFTQDELNELRYTAFVNESGTYEVRFIDEANNEGTASITINNIDKSRPSASFTENFPTTKTNQSVIMTLQSSKPIKITNIEALEEMGIIITPDATNERFTITFTKDATGQIEFTDLLGNPMSSAVTFNLSNIIDKVKPNVTLSSISDADKLTNQNKTATLTSDKPIKITNLSELNSKGIIIKTNINGEEVLVTPETNYASTFEVIFSKNASGEIIVADDASNGANSQITFNVEKIDKAKPNVTLENYSSDTWVNEDVVLTLTSDKKISIVNIDDLNALGINITAKDDTNKLFDVTFTKNASGEIIVSDEVGNSAENPVNFDVTKIDTLAPTSVTATITTPINEETNWYNEDVIVSVEATDNESGIKSIAEGNTSGLLYQVKYDAEDWSEWLAVNPDKTFIITRNAKKIEYRVKAVDNAGNETLSSIARIALDSVKPSKPEIILPTINDYGYYTGSKLTIKATSTDETSGLLNICYELSLDGGTSWTKDCGKAGAKTISIVVPNESRNILYKVISTDKSGLTSEITNNDETSYLKWDKTKPVILKEEKEDGSVLDKVTQNITDPTNTPVEVTFNFAEPIKVTNDVAGLEQTAEYSDTIKITASKSGTITITLMDQAGLKSSYKYNVSNIDLSAPNIYYTNNSGELENIHNKVFGETVTPAYLDNKNEIGTILLTKDGVEVENYSYGEFTKTEDNKITATLDTLNDEGKYVLTITDKAGMSKTIKFTIDKSAPIVKLNSKDPVSYYKNDVKISIKDSSTITATLDGTAYDPKTAEPITTEGEHILVVYDEFGKYAGNEIELEDGTKVNGYKFIIDKTDPSIKIENDEKQIILSNSEWTNQDITATIKFTEPVKITNEITGLRTSENEYNEEYIIDITKNRTIKLTFIDKSGRKITDSFTITNIDKAKPVISIITKDDEGNDVTNTTNVTENIELGTQNYTIPSAIVTDNSGLDLSNDLDITITRKDGTSITEDELAGSTIDNYIATHLGTYYVIYNVSDKAGNIASAKKLTIITADKTKPTASITLPNDFVNGNWYNKPLVVTINGEDTNGSGIKYYRYKISYDGGVTWPEKWSTTKLNETEGEYYGKTNTFTITKNSENIKIQVKTIDFSNNESSVSSSDDENTTIKLDTKKPTISASLKTSKNKLGWYTKDIIVEVTGIDTLSNFDKTSLKYQLTLNGEEIFEEPKTIQDVTLEDGTIVKRFTISLNDFSTEDNVVTSVQNVGYIITGNDVAGNVAQIVNKTPLNIDTIAPTLEVNYSDTNLTKDNVVVTLTPSEDGIFTEFEETDEYSKITETTDINGNKLYQMTFHNNASKTIYFTDNAGNKTSKKIVVKNIDKEAPTIKVVDSLGNTLEERPINLISQKGESFTYPVVTATDNMDPNIKNKILDPIKEDNENGFTLTYNITDAAGNIASVVVNVELKDTLAPTFKTAQEGAKKDWYNEDGVTIKVSDIHDATGVSKLEYKLVIDGTETDEWITIAEGENLTEPSYTFTFKTPGKNIQYKVRATDTLGHTTKEEDIVLSEEKYNIDTELPQVKVEAPKANCKGYYTSDFKVKITAEDLGGSGIKLLQYALNVGEFIDVPEEGITISTEGTNTLDIIAEDNAGNLTFINSNSYKLDKTAAQINYTPVTEWTNQDVCVVLNPTSAGEFTSANVTENEIGEKCVNFTENGTQKVTYIDEAGHEIEKDITVDKIDKTKPEITASPKIKANKFGYYTSDIEITANVTENLSGLNELYYSYSLNNGTTWIKWQPLNQETKTFKISEESNQIKYKIRAIDKAGNAKNFNSTTLLKLDKTEAVITEESRNYYEATKEDVIITFTSNEHITPIEGSANFIEVENEDNTYSITFTSPEKQTIKYRNDAGIEGTYEFDASYIDKTAPSAWIIKQPDAPTREEITVTFETSEPIDLIDNIETDLTYRIVESKDANGSIIPNTYDITFKNSGSKTIKFKDKVGNTPLTDFIITVNNIDRVLPIGVLTPDEGTNLSTATSDPAKFTLTITNNKSVKIDSPIPDGIIITPVFESESDIVAKKFKVVVSKNVDGTINFSDTLGNKGNVVIKVDNIDIVKPTIDNILNDSVITDPDTIVAPTFFKEGKEVTATLVNNTTGITTSPYISGTPIDSDGSYTLTVSDGIGNKTTINFTIDKEAPVLEILDKNGNKIDTTKPLELEYNQSATFDLNDYFDTTIKGKDVMDGDRDVEITHNVKLNELTNETPNYVTFKTTDSKGHETNIKVNVLVNDTIKPIVTTPFEVSESWYQERIQVTLNGSDTNEDGIIGTGINRYEYQVIYGYSSDMEFTNDNFVATGTITNINNPFFNIDESNNGGNDSIAFRVRVYDNNANMYEMEPVTGIKLDTTPPDVPEITFSSNANSRGWITSNTLQITAESSDNLSGLKEICYNISYDGGTTWDHEDYKCETPTNNKISLDIKKESSNILYMVKAVDKAGKYTESKNNENSFIKWDHQKPEIKLPLDSLILNLEANKDETYTIPEASVTDNIDENIVVTKNIDLINLNEEKTHKVTYTSIDEAGNTETIELTINVKDTTAPNIELEGASNVTIELGEDYTDAGYKNLYDNLTPTDKIKVNTYSNLNTEKSGSYIITYTATDEKGKSKTVTRYITVSKVAASDLFIEKNNCTSGKACYNTQAQDNYIWYSGHLWRVLKVNSNGTMKLITEESQAAFAYDDNSSKFIGSNVEEWLTKEFMPSLNNNGLIIKNYYCNLETDKINGTSNNCNASTSIVSNIGLLSLYEYNKVGAENSFLNNGTRFFTMTPVATTTDRVWIISETGEKIYNLGINDNFYGIRPVINIKKTNIISGKGTSTDPYRLEGDESAKTNDLLTSRYSGEYVNFAGHTWRIVETLDTSTRLIYDGYYERVDEYGNKELDYRLYGTYNKFDITTEGELGEYLNNEVYNSLFTDTEKRFIKEDTWYNNEMKYGDNPQNSSLKSSANSTNAYVGLIRVGELMSGGPTKNTTGYVDKVTNWTLNYYNTSSIFTTWSGTVSLINEDHETRPFRPVINLVNTIEISGGNGTAESPYTLKTN